GKHIKDIYNRQSSKKARLLAQFKLGYCGLNSYLHKIKRLENNLYKCGAPETVEHFLY
ncbi:hypothetical protein EV356DRAFT_457972, partial [Viridothelium virens]